MEKKKLYSLKARIKKGNASFGVFTTMGLIFEFENMSLDNLQTLKTYLNGSVESKELDDAIKQKQGKAA